MKTCTKCLIEKPLKEFSTYKTGTRAGRHLSHCKKCVTERTAKWAKENKERVNKYQLAYYHKKRTMI